MKISDTDKFACFNRMHLLYVWYIAEQNYNVQCTGLNISISVELKNAGYAIGPLVKLNEQVASRDMYYYDQTQQQFVIVSPNSSFTGTWVIEFSIDCGSAMASFNVNITGANSTGCKSLDNDVSWK